MDLVRQTSSWNGMKDVGEMATAADMISHGERTGAWPVKVEKVGMLTLPAADGGHHRGDLTVRGAKAVIGHYADGKEKQVGVVGNRFRATRPEEWRSYVEAAVAAGAKPTGALAYRGRVCATFDIGGNGIRTVLVIADSFDSSLQLTIGCASFRPDCANALSVMMKRDKKEMLQLRHGASMAFKTKWLEAAIGRAVVTGSRIKDVFGQAEATYLDARLAKAVFDTLFPEAPKDAPERAKTKAEALRQAARAAAAMPINRVGSKPGNLGTLWNAATYLVDRKADGTARTLKGEDKGSEAMFDSLMFGERANRIRQIQETIEIVMADGTIERMEVTKALEAGVEARQIGKKIVADLMSGEVN